MSPYPRDKREEDIAIVGMACLFPGAESPARFWENIVRKVDCVTDPPPDWQPELFLDPSGRDPDRAYTGKGGYLGDLCRFDASRYGVMPNSVDGAEPDQFIALRCAFEALADAGLPDLPLERARTGVIIGRGTFVNRGYVTLHQQLFVVDQVVRLLREIDPGRSEEELDVLKAELKRTLPPFNAETVPGLSHSVLVGRIANRLDLNGPAYTVDAACASSLIAIDHAMRELRSGSCDAVLVGGVQVSTPALIDVMFCQLGALSRTGKIAPFGTDANGTLLGAGCGMVLLKRRGTAERDGHRIYALLKGVGVSSDGKGAGLLAPRQEGQELALERAYRQSAVSPESVGLIEAHGTGIPLGDATEIRSLVACFGPKTNGRAVALGSVKSMISHLIPAAGIASLIKTALALYHRVLPPTLHADAPSPELRLQDSPFYLSSEVRPWVHADRSAPRRAGVNAFGFGGINTHAILEEHVPADEALLLRLDRRWPVELVLVSADDRGGLRRRVAILGQHAHEPKGLTLLDLAASSARWRGRCRLAVCASDLEDLARKLEQAGRLLGDASRQRIQSRKGIFWYAEPLHEVGRLAFLFPGEGAQYVHMLADLCEHFPEVRRQFDLMDTAITSVRPDTRPSRAIFPLPGENAEAEKRIFDMDVAVESVATADRALLALISSLGVEPDAVLGHSSGEFGALIAAGVIEIADEEELMRCIADGARCTERVLSTSGVPDRVLTAVGGADLEEIDRVVAESGGRVVVAMDNCPHQLVLVGDEEATRPAIDALSRKGALCERLPWTRPYHTEDFAPACRALEEYYRTFRIRAPKVEIWSGAVARPYPSDPDEIRELAVRQWRSPVRFRETIEAMYAKGVRLFVEVGPRGNLTSFVSDTLGRDRSYAAVPLNLPRKSGIEQLCRALGTLAAHGIDLDLEVLYRRRRPRIVDLDETLSAPPQPEPKLELALPELRVGEGVRASLRRTSSYPAVAQRAGPSESPSSPAAVGDARARALDDYQRTMRLFLEMQRRVITEAASGAAPSAALAHSDGAAGAIPRAAEVAPPPAHLIDTVVSFEPGERLVAETEFELARHPFLADHTFGRSLAERDPSLAGLPVMPLAMTMELSCEAARVLCPGLRVRALRNVRALRWLGFDSPTRRVRVEAVSDGGSTVRVSVFEADRGDPAPEIARSIVELSPEPPDLGAARVEAETPHASVWKPDDLYTRGMFHGPAFRSVVSIDGQGPAGVRATLTEPDPDLLLGGGQGRDLSLPIGLVDGVGQVIGLWIGERDLAMGFPTEIRRIEVSGSGPGPGPFFAVVRLERGEIGAWCSDVEICDADGAVVVRMEGRIDRMLGVAPQIWRYRTTPTRVVFSRACPELFADLPEAEQCTIAELDDFPRPFLLEASAFWGRVLARYALDRQERETWDALRRPAEAAVSWLLGRVAAKDAVRLHTSSKLCMADVHIASDRDGRPVVRLPGAEPPLVSFAHRGLDAVAVAVDATRFEGIGIDLEPIAPLAPELWEEAFRPRERSTIEAAASAFRGGPDACVLAAWGAKEAVGKALGSGVLGGPRSVEIIEIDPHAGRLTVELRGTLAKHVARHLPAWAETRIDTWARVSAGRVITLCPLRQPETGR